MGVDLFKDKKYLLFVIVLLFLIFLLGTSYYFEQEISEPFLILFVILSSSYLKYRGALLSLFFSAVILFIQDSFILNMSFASFAAEMTVLIIAGIFIVKRSESLKRKNEKNLEMSSELKKINRSYYLLSEVNQIINRTEDEQELLNKAAELAVEEGNYLHAWIGSWNLEAEKIELKSFYSRNKDYFEKGDIKVFNTQGMCPAEEAVKQKDVVISNDIEKDKRLGRYADYSASSGCSSVGAFPIIIDKKVWGVITLYLDERFQFTKTEIKLLKELTDDLAFALKSFQIKRKRKAYQTQLKESEEKYRSIFDNSPIGIFRTSSQGEIIAANQSLAEIMGCNDIEELKDTYQDLASDLYYDSEKRDEFLDTIREEGEIQNFEFRASKNNGQVIWLQLSGHINEFKEHGFTADGFVEDITERKNMEDKLAESEEKFRSAFMNHNSPMMIINPNNMNIIEANQAAVEYYGYNYREITSMKISDININEDKKVKTDVENARSQNTVKFLFKHRLKSDEIRDVEVYSGPISIDNEEYLFSIIHDITERKRVEEKINHMTFHDVLTGLYNRTYLEEELQRLNTERQLPISLIMADLNNLKMINDTYGHQKGDELLKKAAELLEDSCRHEDLIARQGGDEFVILLPKTPREKAEEIVRRIKDNAENYQIGKEIAVSIALGAASKNTADENIYDVLNRAEDRMYANKLTNKKSGRSTVLSSFLNTLKEKSSESDLHFQNVENYSSLLAEEMDIDQNKLESLSKLSVLHDIGKVVVPEEVLLKEAELNEEEWQLIKQHPGAGYRIISSIDEFSDVAEALLYHHEHWDGGGYPEGLKGEEIPLLSRIISVADAFDVMTAGRPYQQKKSTAEALAEIDDNAGSQFDPELAEKFIKVMKEDIIIN